MTDRQDTEAWADAFLDQHRTGPRPDAQRDSERAARALRELPPVSRWMLTRGHREPDLWTIERIKRSSARQATFAKWEAIFTLIGLGLLCAFGVVVSNSF